METDLVLVHRAEVLAVISRLDCGLCITSHILNRFSPNVLAKEELADHSTSTNRHRRLRS